MMKFRCWHEKEKKFYYFRGIFNDFSRYEQLSEPQICLPFQAKDGAEVYVGDFLKYFYTEEEIAKNKKIELEKKINLSYDEIHEVRFGECSCNAHEYELYGFYRYYKPDGYWSEILTPSELGYYIVVGNVYQNPELQSD